VNLAKLDRSQRIALCALIALIAFIVLPPFIVHWRATALPQAEAPWQIESRHEKEALASVFKECSNQIGFTRIVEPEHVFIYDREGDPTNWKANVDIDYVNKNGGVERTNLIFRFASILGEPQAFIDEGKMWDRQQAEDDHRRALGLVP
jgi:hypothetical protein